MKVTHLNPPLVGCPAQRTEDNATATPSEHATIASALLYNRSATRWRQLTIFENSPQSQ